MGARGLLPLTIIFTSIAPLNVITLMGARGLLPLAIIFTSIAHLDMITPMGADGQRIANFWIVATCYHFYKHFPSKYDSRCRS